MAPILPVSIILMIRLQERSPSNNAYSNKNICPFESFYNNRNKKEELVDKFFLN